MSTEENKAIVRQVEEAWDSGNLDALDALFAPNFTAHSAVPGMPPGLQGAKMAHLGSVQAMPDRRTTIEDLLAEGHYVVARVRMTGTNRGGFPWLSIPANGNKVNVQWTSLYRLADGKIVEHRAVMDMVGLLQQLGAIPAMA
jgi:predicted ester cyclase